MTDQPSAPSPLLWDTTSAPSAFEPADWFDDCTRLHGRARPALPPFAIQSVINAPNERAHLDIVARRYGVQPDDYTIAAHPFAVFQHEGRDVALATSAKGSYAAGGLDELIALGARQIVLLNVGADLSAEIGVGSHVVASSALRDDGISCHYQPASRYNEPSAALTRALASAAREAGGAVHEGPVWTNPAHFRLSVPRLRAFRDEGCLTLENEVASAFAVAAFRGAEVAALVYVGLSLAADRFQVPAGAGLYGPREAERHLDAALRALLGGSMGR